MTITAVGYRGQIGPREWATYAELLGQRERILSGFACTPVSGQTRKVNVTSGVAYAYGVKATSGATETLTFDNVTSGVRWDTVCLRRDWAANGQVDSAGRALYGTTSLVVVPGTSVQQIPATTKNTPGVLHDQPLALVQLTAGQTVPTAVDDLRGIYRLHEHRKYTKTVTGSTVDNAGVPDGEIWPDATQFQVSIPRWATEVALQGTWQGVRVANGFALGTTWVRLGGLDCEPSQYDTVNIVSGSYRFDHNVIGSIAIPERMRGRTVLGQPWATGPSSGTQVGLDAASAFALDLDFYE